MVHLLCNFNNAHLNIGSTSKNERSDLDGNKSILVLKFNYDDNRPHFWGRSQVFHIHFFI